MIYCMNRDLIAVVALGIKHTWGSADMSCYLKDNEAMQHRIEEQYALSSVDADRVAQEIQRLFAGRASNDSNWNRIPE